MGGKAQELYYENELKHIDNNKNQFKLFLEEFYKTIGFSMDNLIPDCIDESNIVEKFNYIKYLVIRYLPQYVGVFYQLLEKFGYRFESEIIDFLRLLGKQDCIDISGDLIGFVLDSPLVQEIEIDGDSVGITSDKLGKYRVIGSRKFFKDNLDAQSLFIYGDVSNKCHQISTTLLHELEDTEIITALMPNYFSGTYYHSYLIDKDGMVIDGANQIVVDALEYDRLFKPHKIIQCKRSELYELYMESIKRHIISDQDGFYVPLAVALSKQLVMER